MYTHFIIKLLGISHVQVRKAGDFKFVKEHNALCYEGREIPIGQFNKIVSTVMERYKDYMPRLPQIVLLEAPLVGAKPERPAEVVEPVTEPAADPQPESLSAPEQGDTGSTGVETAPAAEPEAETSGVEPVPAPEAEAPVEEPAPVESAPSDVPPAEETPAPAPPKKKGGRPPKYGKGGVIQS